MAGPALSQPNPEANPQALQSLLELPQPFWAILLAHKLDAPSRRVLFQTCKSLASLVLQHASTCLQPLGYWHSEDSAGSPRGTYQGHRNSPARTAKQAAGQAVQQFFLALRPGITLSSKRCTILNNLAAGSSRLHLRLQQRVLPLSTQLCSSVHELQLCNIPLNLQSISSLQLSNLCNLRSLALTVTRSAAPSLDETAVAAAIAAGGLSQLRSLHCEGQEGPAVRHVIKALGRLLGAQITQLTTNRITALAALPSLPGLQRLHLRIRPPDVVGMPLFVPDEHACCLFSHPSLQEVSMPSYLYFSAQHAHTHQLNWKLLHLTTPGVRALLAALPLQGVKCLRVEGGILDGMHQANLQTLALANLAKCGHTQWVAEPAGRKRWHVAAGISAGTPLLTISGCGLDIQEVAMCTQHLQGVLLLACKQPISHQQLAALAVTPSSVHTLVIKQWKLDVGCSWMQVCHAIPLHIKHLVLHTCQVSLHQLLPLFRRTAHEPDMITRSQQALSSMALQHLTICQQPLGRLVSASCFLQSSPAQLHAEAAEAGVCVRIVML